MHFEGAVDDACDDCLGGGRQGGRSVENSLRLIALRAFVPFVASLSFQIRPVNV